MRGDFSAWNKDRSHNFRGTLHQQGRVLLDRDWNAQTEIIGEWQETAGRDAFGAGVAAVPAEVPDSFKVMRAKNVAAAGTNPAHVEIGLKKGRVWADGLLTELFSDTPPPAAANWPGVDAVRTATYLGPPIQTTPLSNAVPAAGDRDAVILETWLEELSPFQNTGLLIEPALGGVDTTERVQTAFRFRLYRMGADDTCHSIADKLKDDFSAKGKLTAELKPATATGGDCPVVIEGGFTGFEHRLYRIEIADTDRPSPQAFFKWSHFNGGLVGTGDFDNSTPASPKVIIHGNKNAIVYSGSSNFYLEALDFDAALGCWKVVYGAKASLANDGTITLPDPVVSAADVYKGAIPSALPGGRKRFFRLWNGIERVNDFVPAKKDLPDNVGIMLQFEAEGVGEYTPSDFWTFEARADGIANPLVLIPNLPPQGIFYHRVPLAEINWTSNNVTGDDIEDCRLPFQPLTKLKTCCTYRVGDGINSHGDFKKIQDAINALPKTGGEVCILPGTYVENVVLAAPHNKNIILKGCGNRTIIRAANNDAVLPEVDPKYNAAIHVKHGQNIRIESLAVEAHDEGVGIYLYGEEPKANDGDPEKEKYLKDVFLSHLYVKAAKNNAIKGRIAQFLTLSNSVVHIKDEQTRTPAVYLRGDDMLVERTEIRVLPDRFQIEQDALTNDPNKFIPAQEAAGGLQIGGGSERVRILNNLIVNGTGNGITLGNIDLIKNGVVTTNDDPFTPVDQEEDCCNPDDGFEDDDEVDENDNRAIAGPALYDILIKFNRIFNMGRNGIGVASFFSMGEEPGTPSIDINDFVAIGGLIFVSKLVISENRIERCMNIPPQEIPSKMVHLMGYGGIALALVETLVIRDNFIIDNCVDCLQPICGIFALAATGVDISRNEITEHLPQNYQALLPEDVKHGPRGGIWVFIAMGQLETLGSSDYDKFIEAGSLRSISGVHAAKIHENIVSVPLGRCLTMTLFGDASILGNRFTTYGMVPVDIIKLFLSLFDRKNRINMAGILQILSLFASNVLIFDLGSFVVYDEYKKLEAAGVKNEWADAAAGGGLGGGVPGSGVDSNANNLSSFYKGLQEVMRLFNMFTRAGMIHFSDNQCKLSPKNTGINIALSSILILGMADDGFHDNQSSCNIPKSLLITNALLLGGTVRVTGNWLKESLFMVGFSAVTFGFLNATTDNESVHCLKVAGIQKLDRHNLILGAVLFGVTGDIAEEETRKKLLAVCERNSGSRILVQMYVAITQGQGDGNNETKVNDWIMVRGGG